MSLLYEAVGRWSFRLFFLVGFYKHAAPLRVYDFLEGRRPLGLARNIRTP